ncbi:MAG TPA: DUF2283 domain-containing protein, partial [Tepidiformaceae bacterium]
MSALTVKPLSFLRLTYDSESDYAQLYFGCDITPDTVALLDDDRWPVLARDLVLEINKDGHLWGMEIAGVSDIFAAELVASWRSRDQVPYEAGLDWVRTTGPALREVRLRVTYDPSDDNARVFFSEVSPEDVAEKASLDFIGDDGSRRVPLRVDLDRNQRFLAMAVSGATRLFCPE